MEPSEGPETTSRATSRKEPPVRSRWRGLLRGSAVFAVALWLGMMVSFALDRHNASDRVLRGVVLEGNGLLGNGPESDIPLAGLDEAAVRRVIETARAQLQAREIGRAHV